MGWLSLIELIYPASFASMVITWRLLALLLLLTATDTATDGLTDAGALLLLQLKTRQVR